MRLGPKLGCTYGILILAMAVTSTVAYIHMSQVNRATRMVIWKRFPIVNQDRDARISLEKSARILEDYLFFGSDPGAALDFRTERHSQWAVAETQIAELRRLANAPDMGADERSRMAVIDTEMQQLKEVEDRIEGLIAWRRTDDAATAYSLVKGAMPKQEKLLYTSMYDLMTAQKLAMESESQEVLQATQTMMWSLWITTLAGTLIGGGIALVLAHRIIGGVRTGSSVRRRLPGAT